MTKTQKNWLIIFIITFLLPEVLFSPIIISILFLFGINLSPIIFNIIKEQFFTDHQNYVSLMILIETIGVFGLLFFNIKFNKNKYKNILTTILLLLFIFIFFVFLFTFSIRHGIGF
jgi:hypothetical protein